MNNHRGPAPQQRGIALILVLVFLVVLTLLGTTALRTAKIQEQLAGTTYDRVVARSASDAALADGSDFTLTGCGPTSAQSNVITGSETADGWTVQSWRQNNTNWTVGGGNKATAFGSGGYLATNPPLLSRVLTNPTYIVDQLPPALSSVPGMQVWRVTARGVGGRATTEVYNEIIMAVPGC